MNKLIYGLLAIVIVLGMLVGFFAFNNYIYQQKQVDGPNNDSLVVELKGEVTAIDLSPVMEDRPVLITVKTEAGESIDIAVTSIGESKCLAGKSITAPQLVAVGDLVEVRGERKEYSEVFPCNDITHYFRVVGVVTLPELNLKFSYPKDNNDGYVLESGLPTMSNDSDFIAGYTLMLEADAQDLADSTEPREGPPVTQIRVYKNTDMEDPNNWIDSHSIESNINLIMGSTSEVVVGGANGVSYTIDGLYTSKVYVIASNNLVYVFSADYIEENPSNLEDFQSIINSVEFITGGEKDDSTASPEIGGKLKADVFTGILEVVHTGCFADGECFVIVSGKKIVALVGFSNAIVGSVVGVDGFGDLENHLGETVEVYAQDLSDGTYTLYGNEGFYIKLLNN